MNNINYDYVRLTIEANHLDLIINEFTEFFHGYSIQGNNSKATISGYITEYNFHKLSEKAKHYATVNLDLEELIEC